MQKQGESNKQKQCSIQNSEAKGMLNGPHNLHNILCYCNKCKIAYTFKTNDFTFYVVIIASMHFAHVLL